MTIVVRQYESTPEPVEIAKDALALLLSAFRNKIELRPSPDGRFLATGTNYVGMIRAGELDLVITPKVDSLAAFWMLAYAGHDLDLDADFPLAEEVGVIEVLIYAFATQTQKILRRGIYRTYAEFEDTLPYVRGRILPLEDVRRQLGLRDRVTCRFAELTPNVPHNQILAYATLISERYPLRLESTRRLIAWNYTHFGEIDTVLPPGSITNLRYNRLNDHYRSAINLADLIIRCASFELGSGFAAAPSFLVDMDRVFQDYVTSAFEEHASRRGLFRSVSARWCLDTAGRVLLNPDTVFRDRNGSVRAVIDAKYKRRDAQADCYQALAYAKGLGVDRVALVYPEDGEVRPTTHYVVNDNVEILVRTLPVGHGGAGFTDLESRLGATVRSILDELTYAANLRTDSNYTA